MRTVIRTYLARSGQVLAITVVAALAGMLLVNGLSVASRTVGLGSIHWAHEISIVLALCVYFVGYGLVIRSQAEIRVEFLSKRLPPTANALLRIVGGLIQLGLYLFVGYLAFQYARRASMLSMPMTGASEAWTFVPIVIGFLDAAVVIVLRAFAPKQIPYHETIPPAEI
jgi:TRAP-type C4-dicarboxylate transport system permease small subunit